MPRTTEKVHPLEVGWLGAGRGPQFSLYKGPWVLLRCAEGMDITRISPEEARRLIDNEGYTLLDVRSVPEFAEEHAAGAWNIPYLHRAAQGMISNPDFAGVVRAVFPNHEAKLILSCQMGGRSLRAAAELKKLGYEAVLDLRGGFGSEREDDGSVVHVGWKEAGLPTERGEPEGRSYPVLKAKAEDPSRPQSSGAKANPMMGAEPSVRAAPLSLDGDGVNRFASTKRRVLCARFHQDLPGLKRRPFPGPVGERIFAEVSAKAWDVWVEHQKMLVNEYKMRSDDPAAMKLLIEQCERFFFGEGVRLPEEYRPEEGPAAG